MNGSGWSSIEVTWKILLGCPSGSVHGGELLLELEGALLELEGLLELELEGLLELELGHGGGGQGGGHGLGAHGAAGG